MGKCIFILFFISLLCAPVMAEESTLLVLRLADEGESAEQEKRFIEELSLALEGFQVVIKDMTDGPFASSQLQGRLEMIRPLAGQSDAVATIWIEPAGEGITLLNLVALSTDRALVKIIKAEPGPETEAELALAVQELLGEAYLFGEEPLEGPVKKVVQLVKDEVIVDEPDEGSGQDSFIPSKLWLIPFFKMGGGISDHVGRSLKGGGGLGLEIGLVRGLFARPVIEAAYGPRVFREDGSISGWSLSAGGDLGYRFTAGSFSAGPVVGIRGSRLALEGSVGSSGREKYSWWSFDGLLDLDIRLELNPQLALVLGGGAAIHSQNYRIRRDSDSSIVVQTPQISWRVWCGLAVGL